MALHFIHDHKGKATGVFIPIEDWQKLKGKYVDLQEEEEGQNDLELSAWQKVILDERLVDYDKNPHDLLDFDDTIAKIRKKHDL
jgi:hypothetical protein